MRKPNVKPVLLSAEQMQAIRNIQERERQRSNLGVAPTVHQIARASWLRLWPHWQARARNGRHSPDI